MGDAIASEDAALVADLYDDARRFAAVMAPWDVDPDDVLHGALVGVLRNGRLGDADNPGSYLRRAIVNEIRTVLRRRTTRRGLLTKLRGGTGAEDVVSYPSDLGDLMQLRPIERAVLYLHDIEGLSFDQVAATCGITAGNARVSASRARKRLRAALAEEGIR